MDIILTQDETGIRLEDVLTLPNGATLEGATVQLLIRNKAGVLLTRDAVVDDAATGAVHYETVAEDTAESGILQMRWVVSKDGQVHAAPRGRMMTARVVPRC